MKRSVVILIIRIVFVRFSWRFLCVCVIWLVSLFCLICNMNWLCLVRVLSFCCCCCFLVCLILMICLRFSRCWRVWVVLCCFRMVLVFVW